MADRVGQKLGNYRLIRLLGRGGFAEVYLGEHLRLGTHAAIKVLYTRLSTEGDVEHFEKEARTIAHLKHLHIVRVLDYDVEDDIPFLVMDYAPGGTLRKRHIKGTIIPLPTIVSYVKQVAEALQYAHDEHVIHRDVKPENMLLGERDELLLSDFGIAIVAQSSRYESTQNMAGTMVYMAPEQIQGHPRPASDQYSLGIIVYEWLSGSRPFQGSMTEVVAQHLAVPPPPLHEKVPMISPGVEQVVLTVLEKDSHKRFTSMHAFAIALDQACLTALTRPVTQPSKATSQSQSLLPAAKASSSPDQSLPTVNVITPQTGPDFSKVPTHQAVQAYFSRPAPIPLPKRNNNMVMIIAIICLACAIIAVSSFGILYLVHKNNPKTVVTPTVTAPTAPSPSPSPSPSPLPRPSPTLTPSPTVTPDNGFSFCDTPCITNGFQVESPNGWQQTTPSTTSIEFNDPQQIDAYAIFKTPGTTSSDVITLIKNDLATNYPSATPPTSSLSMNIGGESWTYETASYQLNGATEQVQIYAIVHGGKAFLIDLEWPASQFTHYYNGFYQPMLNSFNFQ